MPLPCPDSHVFIILGAILHRGTRYRGLGCRVFRNETRMSFGYDSLEDVLACLKRMESIVLGLKQLRNFVSQGAGVEILDSVIAEAESQIEEIRRKVIV